MGSDGYPPIPLVVELPRGAESCLGECVLPAPRREPCIGLKMRSSCSTDRAHCTSFGGGRAGRVEECAVGVEPRQPDRAGGSGKALVVSLVERPSPLANPVLGRGVAEMRAKRAITSGGLSVLTRWLGAALRVSLSMRARTDAVSWTSATWRGRRGTPSRRHPLLRNASVVQRAPSWGEATPGKGGVGSRPAEEAARS